MSSGQSDPIYPDSASDALIPPPPRKKGCCTSLKHCLCFCCIKNNVIFPQIEISKKAWARVWARLSGKRDFDPVYMTLLHLYSQQQAIEELRACNIYPNFEHSSRDDLEFYVPQLW